MTELYDVFAGGFSECSKMLNDHILELRFKRIFLSIAASFLLIRGFEAFFGWYVEKKTI